MPELQLSLKDPFRLRLAVFFSRRCIKMAAIIDTHLDEGEIITGVQNAGILMLFEFQGFTQLDQLVKLVSEA
ncbi:hypothetical protein BGX28_008074 [Mortierella sp. GBA30]|nr:hypothetical protein BGX28_008074 [Mortierella sp. GBA30]